MPIESQKPTILEDQRILEALSEIGVYITNYKTEETLISKTWKDIPDRFQVKQISPDFLSHIHPDDREQLARDLDSIKKGVSSNFNCIFRMKDSSGKYKWIKSKGKTVHSDEDGLPILFVGFDTDISELKKTEKKLLNSITKEKKRSEELEILRQIAAGFSSSLDTNETVLKILREIHRIIPYDMASIQILEGSWLQVIGVEGFENAEEIRKLRFRYPNPESLSTKALQERKAVLSNNVTIDFPGFTQPEKGMNINSWIGIPLISHGEIIGLMALDHLEKNQFNKHQLELAEIVGDHIATALENSQLHERTYKMAMEDALTGIGSRHRLQMEGRLLFESAIRSESSLSLAILDIDKFKDVNDTFGHDIGDLVLKRIADTCAQEIRITDLLARLGGEEFIILLPDTTEDKAFQIIDRIRTKVGAIHHPEFDKQVAISAGVYGAVPDKENKLGSYQTKADKALYASKSNGRNRVTLFSSL